MSVDILREKLVAVADAVRDRVDITDKMTLDQMPPYIDGISTDGSHTEVATIIGDGASWIDSMINPSPQYTVETRFRVIGFEDGKYDSPFSCQRTDSSVSSWATGSFGIYYDTYENSEDILLRAMYSDSYTTERQFYVADGYTKQSCRHYKTYKLSKGVFSVDGVNLHTFTTSTNTEHYPCSLYLMSKNVDNNPNPNETYTALIEVCYYKIWDQNDKLILDLVPAVKSDGTVCMYDKVNGGYYYNKGTGTFGYALTTGTEVTYYITSSTYYVEEREEGEDCLPPTSFTPPAKDGYSFLGWAATDGSDFALSTTNKEKYADRILSSMIMGVDPISLYGIYYKVGPGINYYNCTLDSATGTFVPSGTYKHIDWNLYYNNDRNITDTFWPGDTGDAYLDSSSANGILVDLILGASSTLSAYSHSSVPEITSGVTISTSASSSATVLYGVYCRFTTIVYRSAIGVTTNEVIDMAAINYWCANGSKKIKTFTLKSCSFTKSGYSFKGWANTYDSNVYAAGASFTPNCGGAYAVTLYPTWLRDTAVLFDTGDTKTYGWGRNPTPSNGWGAAPAFDPGGHDGTDGYSTTWDKIDCTDYDTCTIRINGYISSEPGGATVNNTYARIGFTTDYEKAIGQYNGENILHKWNNTSGEEGKDGLAYDTWGEVILDVSQLTGIQQLNVFFGGAYQNGGFLWCSKITMSAK